MQRGGGFCEEVEFSLARKNAFGSGQKDWVTFVVIFIPEVFWDVFCKFGVEFAWLGFCY
jgi:hypothetical protein